MDERFRGHLSVFKGQGIEFDEVREALHRGDDIRSIDWNMTSRWGMSSSVSQERGDDRWWICPSMTSLLPALEGGCRRRVDGLLRCRRSRTRTGRPDLFSDRIEKFIPPRKGAARRLVRVLAAEETRRPTNIEALGF